MPPERPSAELHSLAARRAEDARYYRDILRDLNDVGSELARVVHQHVTAVSQTKPRDGAWEAMALAYERVSRAICHGIILDQSIGHPAPSRTERHRAGARRRIIREVETAIWRQARDDAAEALYQEVADRRDELALELDFDLRERPIPEVIADICRDLGLAAPLGDGVWKRSVPQDIAALCALAAQPRQILIDILPPKPGPPIFLHIARLRACKRPAGARPSGYVLLQSPPNPRRT